MRTIPELQEGTHRAKASGILPNGKPVVVNADGTVSVVGESAVDSSAGTPVTLGSGQISFRAAAAYDVNSGKIVIAHRKNAANGPGSAIVGTVSGTSISFGTEVQFTSGDPRDVWVEYDANAQKVVIVFQNYSSSGYGTAVVGTVSGTSISFGSAVVFNSANTEGPCASYDSDAQKVVVAYTNRGSSSRGEAKVGTVSGTSISFGSSAVFDSAIVTDPTVAYDTVNQKTVVGYRADPSGTFGRAIVGTVSGTSISFGSSVNFLSGAPDITATTYDASAQRIVISYKDDSNSGHGTSIVGEVSGTSISFGSPVVFNAASSSSIVSTYDANARAIVVSYRDNGNSGRGTFTTGVVSGNSISFDSPTVFSTGSSTTMGTAYESSAKKVITAFANYTSGNGEAVVLTPTSTSTNLTAENYIGMSTGGTVADGSSATVDIIGSLSTNQSGLTAGQQYYVQTDGTIGETAADPSVFAGTAISATSLVVKT